MNLSESNHKFNASEDSWGFESLMTLADLHDPNKGFIVKDACIVGVEVFVCRSSHEKPMNQAASLTFGSQTRLIDVEVPRLKPEGQCQI
jgi:hypothetical protein